MRRIATFSLGLVMLSTACAARTANPPPADRSLETSIESTRTWARSRPDPSGRIQVEGFAAHVAATNTDWMESPIHQALEFLGIGSPDAFDTTILQEANPEGGARPRSR